MQQAIIPVFKLRILKYGLLTLVLSVYSTGYAGTSITVPGSEFKTINRAMIQAKPGDTVWVENGSYTGHVAVEPGVTLISRISYGAVLDGNGRKTVVALKGKSTISGFEITNGTI
ncbi:MAG: hypothetical protein GF350_11945, partial [Chitinivibrionales bacterium]|nr:hypothetical protein [Chitinivibrionales bacterium]